jgi:hypothetical protein
MLILYHYLSQKRHAPPSGPLRPGQCTGMIPALTGIALWRMQASGQSFPKSPYDTIYIGNNSNNALPDGFIAFIMFLLGF